jgi:2-furoate---CoA ligase
MINTGGENVSPIEIENILSLNDSVIEVAVVGIPDEKWGQKICAFIKRSGDIEHDHFNKFCLESGMANFKRPKEYVFVKEIPKSPTGKILRRKLLSGEYEKDL